MVKLNGVYWCGRMTTRTFALYAIRLVKLTLGCFLLLIITLKVFETEGGAEEVVEEGTTTV